MYCMLRGGGGGGGLASRPAPIPHCVCLAVWIASSAIQAAEERADQADVAMQHLTSEKEALTKDHDYLKGQLDRAERRTCCVWCL